MIKFTKVASGAAMIITMGVAAVLAGPGFASGDVAADAKLAPDLIKVDETVIKADVKLVETAKSGDVKPVLTEKGDIVFEPGTGDFKQPYPDPDPIQTLNENNPSPVTVGSASSLRELVRQQGAPGKLDKQTHCLAGTVYFESKSESLAGQLAVARVVMARAASKRFPNTLCGVVYQKSQFSFIRRGKMPRINKGHRQWANAVAIAEIALADGWDSKMEGALFFHAKYVNPKWRLRRMGSVGQHIFYR